MSAIDLDKPAGDALAERRSSDLRQAGIIVAVHLAFLLVWHLACEFLAIPTYILPSPAETFATLASSQYSWVSNSLVTAAEISAATGSALSWAWRWRFSSRGRRS